MVAHGSRDTDATRRTLGLESRRHVHNIAVDVSAIWNHITDVDADAKPYAPVGGVIAIVDRHLLLHLDRAAERSLNTIEHDE